MKMGKISHFEPSFYEDGSRGSSLKVFVYNGKGDAVFWGYVPEDWVNAIIQFGVETEKTKQSEEHV